MVEVSPEIITTLMRLDPEKRHHVPLRLALAAQIAFPDGSMSAAGLRKERDRGRLVTEMIAGKEYTTLAEIERMRELCRVQAKASGLSAAGKTGTPSEAEKDIALAAARARLKRLRENSKS
jgi:hypothetical protein